MNIPLHGLWCGLAPSRKTREHGFSVVVLVLVLVVVDVVVVVVVVVHEFAHVIDISTFSQSVPLLHMPGPFRTSVELSSMTFEGETTKQSNHQTCPY